MKTPGELSREIVVINHKIAAIDKRLDEHVREMKNMLKKSENLLYETKRLSEEYFKDDFSDTVDLGPKKTAEEPFDGSVYSITVFITKETYDNVETFLNDHPTEGFSIDEVVETSIKHFLNMDE